ncbi:MAG: hypothetical protein NC816_03500 [Candidatus Omnitrophica bacterium]|nr:hypothetical protein [Candidatus Omnitrophota bacterium]
MLKFGNLNKDISKIFVNIKEKIFLEVKVNNLLSLIGIKRLNKDLCSFCLFRTDKKCRDN